MLDTFPTPWQEKAFLDTSKIVVCTGGAGGGKTRLAAEKIHAYAMRYPKSTILILRKNRQSITNTIITFLNSQIWQPYGHDKAIKHEQTKHRFIYPNGTMIIYGGMADESQRQQIRGIGGDGGVDFVWMEEATLFTEEDFQEVLARLRGRGPGFKQILLTTNPDSPHHWIYKRLIAKLNAASIHESFAIDNPTTTQEYLDTLQSIGGIRGDRLGKGLWKQSEGVVYPEYNHLIHHIDYKYIPHTWRRIRAMDFGFRNPSVCLWLAQDHDGIIYKYKEIYQTEKTIADLAPIILEMSNGENIEETVVDHEPEFQEQLARAGIPNIAAYKHVQTGIEAVRQALRVGKDGKPGLYFLGNHNIEEDKELKRRYLPTSTEEEITLYCWDPKKLDEPIKKYDHGLDALRYGIAYFNQLSVDPTHLTQSIDPKDLIGLNSIFKGF